MKKKLTAALLALLMTAGTIPAISAASGNLTEPKEIKDGYVSGLLKVSAETQARAVEGLKLEDGSYLVTDTYNNVIWSISSDGRASILAGAINVADLNGEPIGQYADGTLDTALFMEPWGICPYKDGYLVSDQEANVLRYIEEKGVYTVAGTGQAGFKNGQAGTINGQNTGASFDGPTGLAVDEKGNLYIADTNNGAIRKMTDKGIVSTYVSGLMEPMGICLVGDVLYVAETGRNRIVKVENGKKEIILGPKESYSRPYNDGAYADGPADKALFDHPQGIAVGEDGAIYIADTGNSAVRKYKDGFVTTLAASDGTAQAPVEPHSILIQEDGSLLVSDPYTHRLIAVAQEKDADFTDVAEDAWYSEPVKTAVSRNLISGTGEGSFSPDQNVSRAMFVTMLGRLEKSCDGSAVINGSSGFTDVASGSWYTESVRWAADANITAGSQINGSLCFCPDNSVTRQDLVVFLYRYGNKKNFDVTPGASADILSGYKDGDKVADYAESAMKWALKAGIVSGMGDETLAPEGTATRAQAVRMITSFMEIYEL